VNNNLNNNMYICLAMPNLVKVFNDHLIDFLDDVRSIFSENTDLQTGYTFIIGIKKVNPKSLIKIWKISINDIYLDKIKEGDMDFFLNKDYSYDIPKQSSNVLTIIEDIKVLLRETTTENKNKSLKYVQNLCKICKLYYDTK
tara:strand:- start:1355 stop:1780 length:426 start_codon:yes stop_codon:yes gene_type:complete